MASKALVGVVLTALLLSLVASATACPFGGGGETDAVKIMKMLPKGIDTFEFVDMDALRADDDLDDLYEAQLVDSSFLEESMGIDAADVSQVGLGGGEGIGILRGVFDMDEVGEALEDTGFEEDTYKGVDVWEVSGGWVAHMGDTIIVGEEADVKDCIRVAEEGDDSLYDDRDFKEVIDRLPDGIAVGVAEGLLLLESQDYPEYDGLVTMGSSSVKHDSDSLEGTRVYKFEDGDAAEVAVDDVRDDMENDEEERRNLDVTQDGQFVEATWEMDIEEMLYALDDGDNNQGGGESEGVTEAAIRMMERVPQQVAFFNFQDVNAIRAHEGIEVADLAPELYEFWEETFGVEAEDIARYAMASYTSNDGIWWLEGAIALSEVRGNLEAHGLERPDRGDVELWEVAEQEDYGSEVYWYVARWIILTDDVIAYGSTDSTLEVYLDVMEGESGSMYDDEDFRDVMERLPNDAEVYGAGRGGVVSLTSTEIELEGLELMGMSACVIDEDTADYTYVLRFESAGAARDAMSDINEGLESAEGVRNVQVTRNSEFVIATCEGPFKLV